MFVAGVASPQAGAATVSGCEGAAGVNGERGSGRDGVCAGRRAVRGPKPRSAVAASTSTEGGRDSCGAVMKISRSRTKLTGEEKQ